MSGKREAAAAVGIGAAACAACCAGPVVGFLTATLTASLVGVTLLGSVGLILGVLVVALVMRRRRRRTNCVRSQPAAAVAVSAPTTRATSRLR